LFTRRKFCGVLGTGFLLGRPAARAQRRQERNQSNMIPGAGKFVVELSPRGEWKNSLFPEQSAEFDLALHNTGTEAAPALLLYGSYDTPEIVVLNSNGRQIGSYTKAHQYERKVGDLLRRERPDPKPAQVAAGGASKISFNIWGFRPALPPGGYSVEVRHRIANPGPSISSNRYPFEIVAARIGSSALSYDTAERNASVLAWLAAAQAGEPERLLVRVSATKGHGSLMQGATNHGEFPSGSLVALGLTPQEGEESGLNWVAVLSGKQITPIRHNLSYPEWRCEPIHLSIENAVPVQRFPDMEEQALLLAVGRSSQGPALEGVLVETEKGLVERWTLPLATVPSMTACVARAKRPISLLLVTNTVEGSRISRLDFTAKGKAIGSEKLLRQSANKVMAVAPAMNPQSGTAFFVLERSASQTGHVALVPIPVSGPVRAAETQLLPGWPVDKDGHLLPAIDTQIEQTPAGSVSISLVDSRGYFYAGQVAPKALISGLHQDPKLACLKPHIAALFRKVTPACFSADGRLFYPGLGTEDFIKP
jgi:hypothetical protein